MDRETQSSNDAVLQEDLPSGGGLSGLDIIVRNTNGATSNLLASLLDTIEHIRIVADGNDYLYNLTGYENFLMHWQKFGRPPTLNYSEYLSEVQELHIPLRFGRYLGDPLFGLDLSKEANTQLQLDYNMAAVNSVGATGFLDGSTEISIIAYMTPRTKVPGFKGFLSPRELRTFTSGASGDEYIDIHSSWPISAVGAYVRESGVAPHTNVTHFHLNRNKTSDAVIGGRWAHLAQEMYNRLDPQPIKINAFKSDTDTLGTPVGDIVEANVENFVSETLHATTADATFARLDAVTADQLTYALTLIDGIDAADGLKAAAVTNDALLRTTVSGYPYNLLWLQACDPQLLDDPWITGTWESPSMQFTQGNAGASVAGIVEEIRRQ